jgi:hypothetical protein
VKGPEVVYIDERVTRTMNQEPGEGLVGYVRQDIHEKAVRSAGARGQEKIIQIHTNPDGRLIGLSTWGRVWAFVSETKEDLPNWIPVTDFLPKPELDS